MYGDVEVWLHAFLIFSSRFHTPAALPPRKEFWYESGRKLLDVVLLPGIEARFRDLSARNVATALVEPPLDRIAITITYSSALWWHTWDTKSLFSCPHGILKPALMLFPLWARGCVNKQLSSPKSCVSSFFLIVQYCYHIVGEVLCNIYCWVRFLYRLNSKIRLTEVWS